MGVLRRYWGWGVLAIMVIAALNVAVGPPVILLLAAAATYYFLFAVPNWCGALNRDGHTLCRLNSVGLLRGCHNRQHRWQVLKGAFLPPLWQRVTRELRTAPIEGLKTLSAMLGLAAAIVTLGVVGLRVAFGA